VAGNRHLRRSRASPTTTSTSSTARCRPDLQYTRNGQTGACRRLAPGREAVRVVPDQRRGLVCHPDPGLPLHRLPAGPWPGRRHPPQILVRRASTRPPPRRNSCAATPRPAAACRSAASTPACSSIATTIGGKSFLQTLEPRLFYLRTPYRNQDDLPIFDTRDFTFSWGQLFRDSRYTGADRQNDANQLTLALGTRFIDQTTGKERFSADRPDPVLRRRG
jgi:hypothetical protein